MNIHFICHGNVLRSLIAETYLRSLGIDGVNVASSDTLDVSDIFTREVSLDDIAKGYKAMDERSDIKIIVKP